jgi:catechol 2,3-dioxygenase-like lactoylglutathione lyase family enzyme
VVPARISAVTIGARELGRLRGFYLALGWSLAVDMEDFAAFETQGAVLTLYPLASLAADANLEAPPPGDDFGRLNLAINVDRPEEVDETIEAARAAGARVTAEPEQREFGGRSAYFTDPEGNLWEVVWVPPDSTMAALVRRNIS